MKHQRKWINAITLITTALGLLSGTITQAAEQGKTTGVAAFHAQGAVTEYEPGVGVWLGKFVGVSKTDSGSGPLHNAGWDCTGESVFQEGTLYQADGFCIVTDQGGNTINLIWEQTHVPAALGSAKTKGTYLSGTGKYAGINGYYTFSCQLSGAMSICDITSGEYALP